MWSYSDINAVYAVYGFSVWCNERLNPTLRFSRVFKKGGKGKRKPRKKERNMERKTEDERDKISHLFQNLAL